MKHLKAFEDALTSIRDEGRYRVFVDLHRHRGRFPKATARFEDGEREITVWYHQISRRAGKRTGRPAWQIRRIAVYLRLCRKRRHAFHARQDSSGPDYLFGRT